MGRGRRLPLLSSCSAFCSFPNILCARCKGCLWHLCHHLLTAVVQEWLGEPVTARNTFYSWSWGSFFFLLCRTKRGLERQEEVVFWPLASCVRSGKYLWEAYNLHLFPFPGSGVGKLQVGIASIIGFLDSCLEIRVWCTIATLATKSAKPWNGQQLFGLPAVF